MGGGGDKELSLNKLRGNSVYCIPKDLKFKNET
jgi:hypothetical protein